MHQRLLRLAAIVALTLFMPCAAARAQGFRSGLATALPPPISSLELARYGATMNLAPEQVRAWSDLHERYKADFKALGENGGAIAAFIEARKAAEGVPFRTQPPKAVIDRWMNAHQAAFGAMAALDARLFDELLPILTEEQQPLMQRAKLQRERARLSGDELIVEWLNPNTKTDLCDVFASLESNAGESLSPDALAAVEASLDTYQAQWVSKLRSLQSSARDMYRTWRSLLDGSGVPVNAVDLSDRDNLDMEMFNHVSKAWLEVTSEVQPDVRALAAFNRARARSIAADMPAEIQSRLTRAFIHAAYPETPLSNIESHEAMLQSVLQMPDLTDDERVALQAQVEDCRRTAAVAAEACADAVDAVREDSRPNSGGSTLQAQQALREAFEATSRENSRLSQALYDVISGDRIRAHRGINRDERWREMFRKGGVSDPEEIEELLAELHATGRVRIGKRGGADSVIPDAISKTDTTTIIQMLALNDDETSILRQLHRDYVRLYRKRFDELGDAMGPFALGGWSMRDDGKGGKYMGPTPPEDIEKARAMEAEAIVALRQLDAAFFEDVQAALASDADADAEDDVLWRARLARDWATLARGQRHGSEELRTYEAYIALPAIIDGSPLSADEAASADAVLRARADEFRAAAATQFEANRAARYARLLATALSEGPNPAAKDICEAQKREAIALETVAGEKRLALAALIRAILDDLIAAVPEQAQALQEAFDLAAFPHVFKDSKSAGDALVKALELPQLTDGQRSEIEAAAVTYRPAYRDVCARLIEVNREWDKERPYSRFKSPEREEAKLKWDRLIFERDELNAAVIATLQRVLTPDQRIAIGIGK